MVAKNLLQWLETDVQEVRDKPLSWLSQYHFFRDPPRPTYSDDACFFSPADGVILYQETVGPAESIVDIKGQPYSLQTALGDPSFDQRCLVVGIFMTFYDVHVNRIPFPGRVTYRLLEPIDTLNRPMLAIETRLLEDRAVLPQEATYLHRNQRVVNRVRSVELGQSYFILQIADYDVDSIVPFELRQHRWMPQGARFSQIRFGSQVDLVIPLSERFDFAPVRAVGDHVEAGLDSVVAVRAAGSHRPPVSVETSD